VAIQECKVIFRDTDGVDHSVIVHAETALQAAALGLKRLAEQRFVASDFVDVILVQLTTTTEHKVSLKRALAWRDDSGARSPREAILKSAARKG
jgi:hypothetical protein